MVRMLRHDDLVVEAKTISGPTAVTSLTLAGTLSFSVFVGGFYLVAASGVTWQESLWLGGPAGAIWSFLVLRALTLLPTLAAAELASAFPLASGPHAWVGCLLALRPGWENGGAGSRLVSFVSAALLSLGFIALDARIAASCAENISALARYSSWVDGSGLPPSAGGLSQGTCVGVAMAILCAWGLLHTMHIRALGYIYAVGAAASAVFVVSFSAALLTSAAAYSSSSAQGPSAGWAFSKGFNGIGVDSPDASRYAAMMGLSVFSVFSFYAAPVFLSEEAEHARTTVPRTMLIEFATTSILGFLFVVDAASATPAILLQTYSDWSAGAGAGAGVSAYLDAAIAAVIKSIDGSQIVFAAWGRSAGMAFLVVQLLLRFICGLAVVTVTVRLTFALCRDHAYPFARALRFKSSTGAPIGAIVLVVCADLLLSLLGLFTTSTERAIMRISTCCIFAAFIAPYLLRATVARSTFAPGPWSLGHWSVPIHVGACLVVTFLMLLQFFPTTLPVTLRNANWTVVYVAGFLLLAGVWWAAYAHAHFVPPREWAGAVRAYKRNMTIRRMSVRNTVDVGSAEDDALEPRLRAFLDDHAPELFGLDEAAAVHAAAAPPPGVGAVNLAHIAALSVEMASNSARSDRDGWVKSLQGPGTQVSLATHPAGGGVMTCCVQRHMSRE